MSHLQTFVRSLVVMVLAFGFMSSALATVGAQDAGNIGVVVSGNSNTQTGDNDSTAESDQEQDNENTVTVDQTSDQDTNGDQTSAQGNTLSGTSAANVEGDADADTNANQAADAEGDDTSTIGNTAASGSIGDTSSSSAIEANQANSNPQSQSNSNSQTQNPTIDASNSQDATNTATGTVTNTSTQTSTPSLTQDATGGGDITETLCNVTGSDDDEIDESEGGGVGPQVGVNIDACVQAPEGLLDLLSDLFGIILDDGSNDITLPEGCVLNETDGGFTCTEGQGLDDLVDNNCVEDDNAPIPSGIPSIGGVEVQDCIIDGIVYDNCLLYDDISTTQETLVCTAP